MRLIPIIFIFIIILSCNRKQETLLYEEENFLQDSIEMQKAKEYEKKINFKKSQIESADYIRQIIENRLPGERYRILEKELYSSVLLPRFYIENEFKSSWIQHYDSLDKVLQMINFIENIEFHGLIPEHYHFNELKMLTDDLQKDSTLIFNSRFLSHLDVLLTDSYLMSASHLYHGKVDPESLKVQWGIQRNKPELCLDKILLEQLHIMSIKNIFKQFYPPHPGYENMVSKAQKLKEIQSNDFTVFIEPKLLPIKPRDTSEYIISIREKLTLLGHFTYDSTVYTNEFDDKTIKAVQCLQSQFGYNTDGIIGNKTLSALNMPIEQRLQQLYVNMERLRWLPDSLETRFIKVNIADFCLYMFHENDTLIRMRTIVGKKYRKTPVFSSLITYLVFSPTWTVPPGIMRNDIIPSVNKNPNYLSEKNMTVYDSKGNKIDANSVNWKSEGMKYTVRQSSGSHNALGRVKFMFPNKHNVYLHDTPSKELFGRDENNFSSGCIRIEKAFELAKILLDDMPEWNEARIIQAMKSNSERTVILKNPVGIYIYYLTAWGTANGEIFYRFDIYEHDDDLFYALKEKKV